MYEIPLFPLNTVLFPGTPLHLHIFEERYKRMVSYCKKTKSPFGVVLIQKGLEALGPIAEPFSVGCTAQIAHIQPLEQGRMNIIAIGLERFRILTTRSDLPYLVGIVEPIPIDQQDVDGLKLIANEFQPLFERYISHLSKLEGADISLSELVTDPLSFAYLAAMLLQIPAEEKQDILEINNPSILLLNLQHIYRREIALRKVLLQSKSIQVGEGISFSIN